MTQLSSYCPNQQDRRKPAESEHGLIQHSTTHYSAASPVKTCVGGIAARGESQALQGGRLSYDLTVIHRRQGMEKVVMTLAVLWRLVGWPGQ
jgi:hypothetical protein